MALPMKKNRGFTLLELLIVVAIIGILATAGIPTYKKMVAKSKKSEAKTVLGALYSMEVGFHGEYNSYGNNLPRLGFDIEGSGKHYSVGFPTALCASDSIKPTEASAPGKIIKDKFPTYYVAPTVTVISRAGMAECEIGTLPDDGATFVASASGPIMPGKPVSAPLADQDIWTIDNARTLKNTQDGVQ